MALPAAHPAAKAMQAPAQGTVPPPQASSATGITFAGPHSDRNGAAPIGEAKNDGADAAHPPIAGNAHSSRDAQHIPAEQLRAATSTADSPANAAGKPAAATTQPALTGSPGAAGAVSPIAHILRGGPALSSSNSAPATISAAFTRMDSAAPPQVLESTPQRLNVGVRDGGLGWVEIRTQTAAGQVSAVLATGSSEAHAALQAHLPELRDYLAGQQVRVDQLASEQFSPSGGSNHAPQQEGRGGASGDAETPGEGPPMPAACSDSGEETLSFISVRV
jgi:Flagellar hook-length control protein FliK